MFHCKQKNKTHKLTLGLLDAALKPRVGTMKERVASADICLQMYSFRFRQSASWNSRVLKLERKGEVNGKLD